MRPTVTIAIPTRNRARYLNDALASALAAAGSHDQVIVSDNGSTDETPRLLASIDDSRVTVLRQTADLGMVGNWNACLAAARGDAFLLLSDDDLLDRAALAPLTAQLTDPRVAFVYGRSRVIDETGDERTIGHVAPARERGGELVRHWFRFERTVYPCAVLLRTAELRAVGGYDVAFGPSADVGAWLGIWASDPARDVAFVSDVVASYRTHESALSASGLDAGVAGLERLSARFGEVCGEGASAGFSRLNAHFVASALRRRARASMFPVVSYCSLLVRHAKFVLRHPVVEPYWRQVMILVNPAAYERRKQHRAAADGTRS